MTKKREGLGHVIPLGGSGCVGTSPALTSMKRARRSNRISQGDLFTLHLSLPPCHTAFLPSPVPPLPWHCWRWVAPKSRSGRRLRLQRRLLTCFNNFLPSSANLCKYFSPVSSSLEGQLRVCVWFRWQMGSGLADSRPSCCWWCWRCSQKVGSATDEAKGGKFRMKRGLKNSEKLNPE